jgi:hypothetical protein
MAKPKLRKYPKKPKANSSKRVMENYLNKVKEIDKENAQKIKEYNDKLKLLEKIRKI